MQKPVNEKLDDRLGIFCRIRHEKHVSFRGQPVKQFQVEQLMFLQAGKPGTMHHVLFAEEMEPSIGAEFENQGVTVETIL